MKKTILHINCLHYLTVLFLILLMSLLFQQNVYAQNAIPNDSSDDILKINNGWVYQMGDSPFSYTGEPLWLDNYNLSTWKSFNVPGKPKNEKNLKRVWLSTKLPMGYWKEPCLILDTYEQDIEIYLDKKVIYSYGDMHSNENFNRPGTPLSIIPLPDNFQNKNIFIRLRSTKGIYTGMVAGLDIGSKSDIIMKIFFRDIDKIIFSFIFIFIGLICILVFLLRQSDQKAFFSIGTICILISFWIISETQIKLLFFNNPKLWYYIIHTSNYLVSVGFLSYIEQVFSSGKLKIALQRLWQFQIFFVITTLTLDIFGITPLTTFINLYFVLFIFYIGFTIFTVAYYSSKGNLEVKIFFSGFIILAISGIHDFLSIYYRILPWPSISLIHIGMLLFILSLLFINGRRFIETYDKLQIYSNEIEAKNRTLNKMWSEIKKSRDTLALWNENLEETVTQKTLAIKNILDNAGQGFLTLSDDLLIDEEYSIECEKIFGQSIYKKSFSSLIFPEGEERVYLEIMLIKILNEAKEYKKEIYIPLLPNEMIINGKNIKINYKIIVHSQTKEKIIMVILTDITDKRILESKMEAESKVLKMVVKAVTNYNDFIRFIRDYENFCKNKIYEILNSDQPIQNIVFELFRAIHTFKGTFYQMDMVNIVQKLNTFETKLSEINSNVMGITLEEFKLFLSNFNVSEWLKEDMKILEENLGEDYFIHDRAVTIDQTKLVAIENKLNSLLSPDQLKELLPQLRKLHYKPFKELLKTYQQFIRKLSERLKKPMNLIEFKGEDVYVNFEKYHDFSISLVHVFRNIMDHGIDELNERISSGKSDCGNITCIIEAVNNNISLIISDDGKGIDINKIKEIAIRRNMYDKHSIENLSEKEVLNFIFLDGFTTKNSVTDLSGRGIGLAAVKNEVEKLNGSITVKTELGIGTEFHFLIPILN